jgi:protein-tyrosine phosphatase
VVQLTGWEERGIIKADRYLLPATFGELAIKVDQGEWREDIKCKVTKMRLNEMEVLHYHFEAWPDHGVPEKADLDALRRLVHEVDDKRDGEVWVHWYDAVALLWCGPVLTPSSAGVGRTGTFIALSSLLLESKGVIPVDPSPLGPLPGDLDRDKVAQTVDKLREFRGLMVQSPEQLRLIYEMTAS